MASTIDTRLVGRDIQVLSFDGGTYNVLALYAGASLDIRVERVDVTAVKDDGRRSRVVHYDWRVTVNTLVDSSYTLLQAGVTGTLGDFTIALTVGSAASPTAFTGTVGYTGLGTRFDEAAQGEGTEFVGVGNLSIDGTELTVKDHAA